MIRAHIFARRLLVATLLSAGAVGLAQAETVKLASELSAANEVPAISSTAAGKFSGTLDTQTNVLKWKTTYTGLSGPASAAHFHGPAAAGQNAGVVVPIKNPASGADGEATLTPAQTADLLAGKWYVNVHTAAHPGGEIRGQVEHAK